MQGSGEKKEEFLQKIEQAKREHGKKIQDAFKSIGINIAIEKILASFDSLKKLGVTNTYLIIEFENKPYIVRINGKLWPPYKRMDEQYALSLLKSINIDTNVLFNDEFYQICEKPDDDMKLSSILESKNDDKISRALRLVSSSISRYHESKVAYDIIDYPIEKMIDDAKKMLRQKFGNNYPQDLEDIEKGCAKILRISLVSKESKIFSHNDLLPSSIFIDLSQSKVSIVDWEYSAQSFWSNDLAILSCSLNREQRAILFKHYYEQRSALLDVSTLQLEGNIFLHEFLRLAWKITPEKIREFEDEIRKLKEHLIVWEKLESFDKKEIKESKPISVNKRLLFQSSKRWVESPLREIMYSVLEEKLLPLLKSLDVETILPEKKSHKTSSKGWQLLFDPKSHTYLAIITVNNRNDANKIASLINASGVKIHAKVGKSDNIDCVILSFSPDIKLGVELDNLRSFHFSLGGKYDR